MQSARDERDGQPECAQSGGDEVWKPRSFWTTVRAGHQARRAFENLKAVLAAAGANLSDIVKVTVLLVELSDLPAYRNVREIYVPHLPASTLSVVKSLAVPELLFEIEAIAVRD